MAPDRTRFPRAHWGSMVLEDWDRGWMSRCPWCVWSSTMGGLQSTRRLASSRLRAFERGDSESKRATARRDKPLLDGRTPLLLYGRDDVLAARKAGRIREQRKESGTQPNPSEGEASHPSCGDLRKASMRERPEKSWRVAQEMGRQQTAEEVGRPRLKNQCNRFCTHS